MKLKVASLLLLSAFVFGAASAQQDLSKKIDGHQYESLKITGPVTVELIESASASVDISGDSKLVNGVDVEWTKRELFISYSPTTNKARPVVKVYGYNLKEIVLEDGANLVTAKPLHSPRLMLTVNDDAQARILNYGKIRVFGNGHVQVKSLEAAELTAR
jgi:hypothetical protein